MLKQINEGWYINPDKYEQIFLQKPESERQKFKIMALLNDKEVQLDWFNNEEDAINFLNRIVGLE